MPTRIDHTFAASRAANRLAFMPFITAGDPDLTATQRTIGELANRGVDLIEIGFPYSDPIADGPVIQSSYTRALAHKLTVPQIFDAVSSVSADAPPLLAMVSYALMFRRGAEWFVDRAKAAGFSGFIVPDLPGDEAADLFSLVRSRDLDLVQLVAPTTPRERVRNILKSCSGFVYCIAVAGTTGERERVADALLNQLRWLKEETSLPLAVGFGISKPEHVEPLRDLADGVIVGSAIVRQFEAALDGSHSFDGVLSGIGEYATSLVAACEAKP
ncbi:MAG: tryptophan synthase subunit alpha [Planctomycetaceae bacterium]|nr:tryptophan synthase subunit alpha [Planctomycetaceae bacterium]